MLEAIFIGLASFVYVEILQDRGMIFNGWCNLMVRMGYKWEWFTKPLGLCVVCNSGQLAMWVYLYRNWNDYDLMQHIYFVCVAIIVSKISTFIYQNK